jgi:hypothetical protein
MTNRTLLKTNSTRKTGGTPLSGCDGRRGIMLLEMIVYLAVFGVVMLAAGVAVGQAFRFLNAGFAATERRAMIERSVQHIARDVRNARRMLPAWGSWSSDAGILLLEMPPGPEAPAGEVVVYAFLDDRLVRGHSARPEVPMSWTDYLVDFDPVAVEFGTPPGLPGAVRVRLSHPAGREPATGAERVWEIVAAPRGATR